MNIGKYLSESSVLSVGGGPDHIRGPSPNSSLNSYYSFMPSILPSCLLCACMLRAFFLFSWFFNTSVVCCHFGACRGWQGLAQGPWLTLREMHASPREAGHAGAATEWLVCLFVFFLFSFSMALFPPLHLDAYAHSRDEAC